MNHRCLSPRIPLGLCCFIGGCVPRCGRNRACLFQECSRHAGGKNEMKCPGRECIRQNGPSIIFDSASDGVMINCRRKYVQGLRSTLSCRSNLNVVAERMKPFALGVRTALRVFTFPTHPTTLHLLRCSYSLTKSRVRHGKLSRACAFADGATVNLVGANKKVPRKPKYYTRWLGYACLTFVLCVSRS